MYGWRARIGIVYGTGFTDHEYHLACPKGVSVHVTRVLTPGLSEFKIGSHYTTSADFLEEMARCATILGKIRPSVVVWMTTSGSFSDPDGGDGHDWDRRLKARMSEAAEAPCTTTSTSAIAAMRALDIRRVAIASPYKPEAEVKLKAYVQHHGIEVVAMNGLGCEDVWEIGNLTPEVAYRTAVEADCPEVDAVFIAETSFRAFEVLECLEADLGKPVFSANGASMWHALCLAGVSPVQQGLGTLFRTERPRQPWNGDA